VLQDKAMGAPTLDGIGAMSDFKAAIEMAKERAQIIRQSMELLQLELGKGIPLFSDDYETYQSLATDCWLKNVWRLQQEYDLQLKHDEMPVLTLQSSDDSFLMSHFADAGFTGESLWLTNPQEFAIPTCSYASLETMVFPALINGTYPPTIIDQHAFSPLLDMHHGLAWRLHCDKVLTITTGPRLQHFRTFLQRGADGITTDTYVIAAVPGRFCPNIGFHFKPHNEV
jgi:hypothetical protein